MDTKKKRRWTLRKKWTLKGESGHKEKVDTEKKRWTQKGEGGHRKEKVDRGRQKVDPAMECTPPLPQRNSHLLSLK